MNSVSVVIPSYKRGQVLLDTIVHLRQQSDPADEIIIVDQTDYANNDATFMKLQKLHSEGVIQHIQRSEPSIPKAMNVGLLQAKSDCVLFLDDDIQVCDSFVGSHKAVFETHDMVAQVGQVLQPNQKPQPTTEKYFSGDGLRKDLNFMFNSTSARMIDNCMAGNLYVDRLKALEVGGFDENFIGAAYRFETEFCRRMVRYFSKSFYFTPRPVLHHLQCKTGGTRTEAHFLVSSSPHHSVGDYYYALLGDSKVEAFSYCLKRFLLSIKARHYLTRPWHVPLRLLGEVRGLILALKLFKEGPKYCSSSRYLDKGAIR